MFRTCNIDLPEAHDVIRGPADEEDHEYDDGHFESPISCSVEEHEAGATEAVVRAELVATEDLCDDADVRDDYDEKRHAVHKQHP